MKRILSTILAITCMLSVLVCVPFTASAAEAITGYAASEVTEKEGLDTLPDIKNGLVADVKEYKVTDAAGIEKMAAIANGTHGETINNFAGYSIYLANDIDMTGITHEPIGIAVADGVYGTAWVASGEKNPSFRGTFDGQGHAIKNLTVNDDSSVYKQFGLFGQAVGATIQNLVIDSSCSITLNGSDAGEQASFVVAYAYWSLVMKNVAVRGTFDGKATYVGGLVARFQGGGNILFQNCEVSASMTSTGSHFGAFAGSCGWQGAGGALSFKRCKNAAAVNGASWVGGYIGIIAGCREASFTSCTSSARVTGHNDIVGGYVGSLQSGALKLTFTDCVNRGTVSNNRPFVGVATDAITAEGAVTVNGVSIAAPIAAGTKGASWGYFAPGIGVGYDASKVVAKEGLNALNDIKNGLVDEVKEYRITDAEGIERLAYIVNGTHGETANQLGGYTFYLANDIDMTGVQHEPIGVSVTAGEDGSNPVYGRTWVASGDKDPSFRGTFDGQGYTIRNLVISDSNNGSTYLQAGLFGQLAVSTIKNLIMDESCSVTLNGTEGGEQISLLACYGFWGVSFENLSIRGSVSGKGTYCGAVLARFSGGANCIFKYIEVFADLTVTADHLGGFAGSCASTASSGNISFEKCRMVGDVSGSSHTGGFMGVLSGAAPAVFTDCIQNGDVSCTTPDVTGGFIGGVDSANLNLSFNNCLNYGAVSNNRPFVGMNKTAVAEGYGLKVNGVSVSGPIAQWATGTSWGTFTATEDDSLIDRIVDMEAIFAQVKLGTTVQSSATDIRVVSAIDSLSYSQVGFRVWFTDGEKTNLKTAQDFLGKTVYSSIVVDGTTFDNPSQLFGKYGQYFVTLGITDIPQEYFGMTLHVQLVAQTSDGELHVGSEQAVTVSSLFN